ncbi:MAG TPA: hypothetical protein VHX36_05410 [Candidatus Acidoferrales bacterium]|jgi:hypothetical protein|nr:hypothetical protein [Candidatus Acidoferrales bacterium]
MSSLQFQYEIPPEEFVAAQRLYRKVRGAQPAYRRAALWILLGAAFVAVVLNVEPSELPAKDISAVPLIIVMAFGISWIYGGVRILFPGRYYRRAYRSSELTGKSYQAEMDENGFHVAGEFCEWSVKWPGVQIKGEDERVFIFARQIRSLSSERNS